MRSLWIVVGTFAVVVWDLSYDHGAVIGTVYDVARQILRSVGLA